jgi:hypothetical protein
MHLLALSEALTGLGFISLAVVTPPLFAYSGGESNVPVGKRGKHLA